MDRMDATETLLAFGPFRVDEAERALLREGVPVPLRAKLFDTLLTLLHRPGRLVTRQDLLEAVWPDSIVEEGNLSHNVSVLRKTLRDGEDARYIETVPKQGYRFVHAVERVPREPAGAGGDPLDRARRFFDQGAWQEAYRLLARANAEGTLAAADRSRLAHAARWSGRYEELVPLLEGAAEAYRREGDAPGVARTALELAGLLLERCRTALAASYVRQAERVLDGAADARTPEHAELARLQGRLRWTEGDWAGALQHARTAVEAAHASGDRGAEAMALMDAGHSLLALGRYGEAATALEEAGAVLTAGDVGPYAAGTTQCGLIHGWRACGRWDRAGEWVEVSIRWADAAGVAYFPGQCRVHRGELISLRGELARAEEDLALGTEELIRASSSAAGPGLRELGSVRLRLGDLDGAEEAFRRALEFGTEPQPGLARLHLRRGEVEAARRDLERFLSAEGGSARTLLDREYRFEALAAYVETAADGGAEALAALEELEATAGSTGAPYHRAVADGAAGALARAEGRIEDALRLFQRSWRAWTEIPAPYEAACVRETLGDALLAVGDGVRARIELEGAARTFERLGAAFDLRRVRARLQEELGPDAAPAPRLVACAEIVDSAELRAVVGAEAWKDLSAWLQRTLTGCWHDHGGLPLSAGPNAYAVAFDRLDTCLRCVAHVQRSLRAHRTLHGFAPRLHLAVADASAVAGRPDLDALRALALRCLEEGPACDVTVLASEEEAAASEGLERLRREGVRVELATPGTGGGTADGGPRPEPGR